MTQETCWTGRCTGSSVWTPSDIWTPSHILDSKSAQVWADVFIRSGGWAPGQRLPWVSHICLDLINMMHALNFNKPVVLVHSVGGNLFI